MCAERRDAGMCTAVTYRTEDHYFGRTLDYTCSYGETVTVTPRRFPFHFRLAGSMETHFAMIGTAFVTEGQPLYYDATNEKGLSMAGLNFPGNGFYPAASGHAVCGNGAGEGEGSKVEIASFEIIPWILGQCTTAAQARTLLKRCRIVNLAFQDSLPPASLHWTIADRDSAITVESMRDGMHIYENPIGILTNNPPFDYQMMHLNQYLSLTPEVPVNRFCSRLDLQPQSQGVGAFGLPGDASSQSRFVRAAFTKLNAVSGPSEMDSVSQFFHILEAVSVPRGTVRLREEIQTDEEQAHAAPHGTKLHENGRDGDGRKRKDDDVIPQRERLSYDTTIYSSCCNTDKGIYYYRTYENSQISGVALHRTELDDFRLRSWPLIREQQIRMQN